MPSSGAMWWALLFAGLVLNVGVCLWPEKDGDE